MKLFVLRKPTRKPVLPLLLALALLGCSETPPNESQNEGGAPPTGSPTDSHSTIPRSDTPEYGVRGPYFVGFHTYNETAPHRPNGIDFKVWYPTDTTASDLPSIEYPLSFKSPEWENFKPALVYGYALKDAPLAESESALPVVVFSHGYSLSAEFYSELVEHFASRGFVVIAPEHEESDWFSAAQSLFPRPLDVTASLDFAEEMNAKDEKFSDRLDLDRIAIVGHSFGGYTALASAGARLDLAPFDEYCSGLEQDDPAGFVCAPFAGQAAAIAESAGLSEPPDGLWPSQADKRIKAAVSLAGDAYMFGQDGLHSLSVPLLALGGTLDFGTPWELGAQPSFEHAGSEVKFLIGLEGGNHMLPATRCEFLPWSSELMGFEYSIFCEDPVWEKQRALDLIFHYTTAFLELVLNEEQDAANALTLPAGYNPGVSIEAHD